MQQGTRKAKWLSLIVAAAMVLCMLPVAAFAAGDEEPTLTLDMPETFEVGKPVEFTVTTTKGSAADNTMVIGTAEFDGADAVEKIEYYEVKDGNWYELTGDSFGPSSGFPLSDATSKFRVTFKEAGSYSLTVKIVKVDGGDVLLEQTCTITSVEPASITGVKVVDGTDGYTVVTAPKVGQKLTANIQTSEGEIGSYPVNEDAHYKWYYEGSDAVLGTDPTYTVTGDNEGKVLCVEVTVDGYEGSATWKAEKAVMMSVLVPIEGAAIAIEGVGDEKYVTGVMAGMEANEVIALFEEAQAGARIVVLDQEGNELGEKLVGTGCTVKLVDEADVILDAVVVVIDGDVQGDGEVNVLDLIAMARHVTNSEEPQLMGVYFKAADVNADENVNVLDMIAVCKAIIE